MVSEHNYLRPGGSRKAGSVFIEAQDVPSRSNWAWNPHIIQLHSDEPMTTDLFRSAHEEVDVERLEAGPDLLAQLMEDNILLPDMEAPDTVRTAIFKYIPP